MKSKICLFLLFISSTFIYAQRDTLTVEKEPLFPLMKSLLKKADSLGFEFPKTYGISASMYHQKQKMDISKITVGNIILNDSDDFVNIDNSTIENTTLSTQVRTDVWVLPFLNVYGMVGRVTTFNNLRLRFNLDVPPIPGLTEGDFRTLERDQLVNINGTVLAFGTILAGGYKNVFININLSWASTSLEELDSKQKAFAAFPMIGLQTKFANIFVGGLYLDSGQENKGSFVSGAGEVTNYEVEFQSQQWNYNIGLNKSIGNWSLSIIQGFGERNSSIIEVGYRFN
ncbi:hypothetical protein [Snuella lapsa]|uniref:Outer membrane protein beta-barrel domain-containing protein n=1 Tax=Snuella lapsa TaxID=870481 RepID=A0ABP6XLR7_9FLAO